MLYDLFFILWNAVFYKLTDMFDKFSPDPWNRFLKFFYLFFLLIWIAYFIFDLHHGRIWM
jgi:hypothetical protein